MTLRTEAQITKNWPKGQKPLLSIMCITYNHENFVSQTLDSFLMQETTFPFEIIIGEDCSTDKTLEVLKRYQKKYPNLITIISGPINVGANRNFARTLKACQGEYIAFCEGDDYWTDPQKLQIQVDFLEKNPEYVLSFHNYQTKGKLTGTYKIYERFPRDHTSNELIKANRSNVQSLTRVWRNCVRVIPNEAMHVTNLDRFFLSLLGSHGKAKFHKEISPGIYRLHAGGVWSSKTKTTIAKYQIKTHFLLAKYHLRENNWNVCLHFTYRTFIHITKLTIHKILEKIPLLEKILTYAKTRKG